jgi:hypothetical protein
VIEKDWKEKPLSCKLGLHRYRKTWTIGWSECVKCGKGKDRL